jgi:uncharacterized protein (DUF362 family)/Pyruvate/2-oxoacid:ferredoxin oxidoreductase delta subunit
VPKSIVSIARCNEYDLSKVSKSLTEVLEPIGGINAFVKPGNTVLIKINLLRGCEPDKAVTTHPTVIEAVIRAVQEAGGTPVAGDSPGGPNMQRQIDKLVQVTGVKEVCDRTGAEFVLFDRDTTTIKSPEAKLFTSFTTGHIVSEADVIITLPKLKTHGLMKFTGAVKVLFGVIPGLEKAQFHLKVPDRMDFADMLLDIYLAVKPALSIMDGVIAMEGDGPSGGDPKHIGALFASTDSIALDCVASSVIGFNPLDVYTNKAAVVRGLIANIDDIEITGAPLAEIIDPDFKHPKGELADEKAPGWLVGSLKSLATSMPYLAIPDICSGCGTCKQSCPAGAITYVDKKPTFDYDKCIRCYCCEELCPEVAIKRKNHWLVRPFVGK